MSTPNLLDAIRIVKENERLAAESYANAAKRINTLGKVLFEKLSEFEHYHYERISALEKSLEEKGDYIRYEGREFILPPILEIKFTEEADPKSLMTIISEAKKVEKQAETTYTNLAGQLTDHPEGQKMFQRLAQEEHKHFEILSKAHWDLNETGVWKWSG